ncbi:helix-turn-helix transcriptional regulator [bacterium]|nr:helix-turn-helix transcriptional regulator [bacterium]
MTIDIESVHEKFSQKIQIERVKKKLSQEKLAELANIHRTTVSAIERQAMSPSLETICHIANALNLSLKEIFNFNF